LLKSARFDTSFCAVGATGTQSVFGVSVAPFTVPNDPVTDGAVRILNSSPTAGENEGGVSPRHVPATHVAFSVDVEHSPEMHSASIDVGKILSDEVDEKAWEAYLKGDRGVFTRRAARLIGSSEARAIRAHYESDGEFQQSANRYIHDFEAMLRRVMAERDGGMIAVTLMSSDMGKLYAALSDSLDRRR